MVKEVVPQIVVRRLKVRHRRLAAVLEGLRQFGFRGPRPVGRLRFVAAGRHLLEDHLILSFQMFWWNIVLPGPAQDPRSRPVHRTAATPSLTPSPACVVSDIMATLPSASLAAKPA